MNDLDLEALARRAIASKDWRWMPGMLTTYATRVHSVTRDGLPQARIGGLIEADPLPALDDSATLGCLLALVREAWGPTFHLIPQGGWLVQGARLPNGGSINLGICEPTQAAALVAALEVAP